MRYLRRNWYNLSPVLAGLAVFVLLLWWDSFSVLQRLSLANLAVFLCHVFEEFGFPGGFGKLANTLLYADSPAIDRWPLNQNSVMVGNWGFALLFYVPPLFFPQIIWLGLMPMLFGAIGQVLAHGILNNLKLREAGLRWGYNAGLATAICGHLPLAVAYGWSVETHGLSSPSDWFIGVLYAAFAYAVVFRLGFMKTLADRHSPYPFAPEEMARFDRLYQR